MNKVIAVNLNGNAYQLEEIGYDRLHAYLDNASASLTGNPDRDEIIADIEQAIGDKFRATLGPHKTVVATKDVERIISEMGSVDGAGHGQATADAAAAAGSAAGAAASAASPAGESTPGACGAPPRRLYLIHEGAMLGGVCNGIAAYLNVDVTVVRILFALTCLLYGVGVLVYLIMMFVVPSATTPEQKATAQGLPKTAQEFIRRAKEGYYQGMNTWGDRRAHREWKRKFKRDMKEMGQQIKDDAQNWRHNWQRNWGNWHPAAVNPGAWMILNALKIAFVICLLLVLFNHHSGLWWTDHFPGTPWWVGLIVVVLLFKLVCLPFKFGAFGGPFYAQHWHAPFEGLFVLLFMAFGVWYLNRHVPAFHEFLQEIPTFIRQSADFVHDWWVKHVH
ncbi:MAG TPA: PspC domain-containing protein [Opitutaceae bacterium]|jgi:phage shock protein PspC (stress-responsive transcriptional regulator)